MSKLSYFGGFVACVFRFMREGREKSAAEPRRTPRQERSQKRVAAILDAAGDLMEESGYAALTTNAIAARADTSIGSLYQFFPNKEAVISELVREFRQEVQAFIATSLSAELAVRDIREFVNVVVDGMEQIRVKLPGFSAVFSFRRSAGVADDQRIQLEYDIIRPLSEILADAYPEVPAARRDRCMRIVAESTKVLMGRAAMEDEETRIWMREELKQMLGLYLSQRIGK
jgi:AcrR family transcriptional regulator